MGIKNKFIPLALSKNDNFKKTKKPDHFIKVNSTNFLPTRQLGMMHVTCIERLMEWGFLSLEMGDLKEELIAVYSYPTGEGKTDMHSGRTRGNGCKLEL